MKTEPLKRHRSILKLSKEHHFSLLFCWKIRQGVRMEISPERIIRYTQYFRNNYLCDHFREEEAVLFSQLKDKLVEKALADHRQIESQFDSLASDTETNINERLTNIANAIDDHVRYEERVLFPHLEKMLSEQGLKAIEKQLISNQPPVLIDEYEDEFWIKNKLTNKI